MRPSPDPVWTLFRRRTFSRLAYWFQVLGFDLRDRSLSNLFYFFYFCAFWLAWGVATFAILGHWLAKSFKFLPEVSPPDFSIRYGAIILVTWGLIKFWQVVRRSPFVFSESDAYLLCQAPVSRWRVGLAWFLMDWFRAALPFAAGSVILSFALTYLALSGVSNFQALPTYFAANLRSLAIVLPLQMGLQAGLYGLGAWRLRRDRPPGNLFWLRLTALPLSLVLFAALIFHNWGGIILAPLSFPLQAAFSDLGSPTAWLLRAALAFLILVLGMASLLVWSGRMHLGRAAQETRVESVIRQALRVMNFEVIETLHNQKNLSATHSPSQLPIRSGVWVLVWKNLTQSWRSTRASQVGRWVYFFFLSMIVFLPSSWVARLILGGFWAVLLGSLVTDRLRSDLARWWLLRSLPFQNSHLLFALLGPAWGLGVLLSSLALVLTRPPTPFGWLTAALLPFLAACAALGSTFDILIHAKSRVLMAPGIAKENVPRQDIQGVLIILISVGFPLGLLTWSSSQPSGFVWGLLSLPLALLITIVLRRFVLSAYRWIK